MSEWTPDILGNGFEAKEITLGEDHEGPIVATIVRSHPKELSFLKWLIGHRREFENIDILYLHGWSDYFFQTELANFWTSRGARFYALDLRKYGRSLRNYQTAGYIDDLSEYDAEIAAALAELRNDNTHNHGARKLVLLGHSTGGLTLSLWAARNQNLFDAMILNSPWLEFQFSSTARRAVTPLIELTAKLAANEAAPQIDMGYYSRAQQEVATPEHPLNIVEKWRPTPAMAVRAGWFRAIIEAQEKISHKLHITKPILVMVSEKSELTTKWEDKLKYVDSVLSVEHVAKASLNLGNNVTIMRINKALHDVFLSTPEARNAAYRGMENWLVGILAAQKTVGL